MKRATAAPAPAHHSPGKSARWQLALLLPVAGVILSLVLASAGQWVLRNILPMVVRESLTATVTTKRETHESKEVCVEKGKPGPCAQTLTISVTTHLITAVTAAGGEAEELVTDGALYDTAAVDERYHLVVTGVRMWATRRRIVELSHARSE